MIAKGDLVRRHGRQRIRTVLQYYITLSEAVGHVCTRSRVRSLKVAEAPWSEAEWAVALFFVELLQAQPGRHARYP